jgi:hypothetical protein
MAAKSGQSIALDTNEVPIFDAETCGGVCKKFTVINDAASAGDALVNVVGLHKIGEYAFIPKGAPPVVFKISRGSITTITAKAATTATIKAFVSGR